MARMNLTGMGVALITPFCHDKTIDFDALARLIEYQIKNGVDFLVALGTTAETATLTTDERSRVRNFIVDRVAGRVPLVLGCGGNNTAAVIEEINSINLRPFSAILSVVPYYNKPSQEGIFQHYSAIAKACPIPVILYNVPGRTGVNMTAETTLRLARAHSNIIGIKEASGNLAQMDEIIKNKEPEFSVISGDDALTYPLLTLGAVGVISVIGNAFPVNFPRWCALPLVATTKIHSQYTTVSPTFTLCFLSTATLPA